MEKLFQQLLVASFCLTMFMPIFVFASELDADNDGLLDRFEEMIHTSSTLSDSDSDGFPDRAEVLSGFSPTVKTREKLDVSLYLRDSDSDGLTDYVEANINSDYLANDTDGDGYMDGEEINSGFSPLEPLPIFYGKQIEVDTTHQTLSYFVGPHHINTVLVSTGMKGMDTPKGDYMVQNKLSVHRYTGLNYDYKNTKWNLLFKYSSRGNYFIHGAFWHNKFGTKRSHGCVNVSYADIEPIYKWADMGTAITIR